MCDKLIHERISFSAEIISVEQGIAVLEQAVLDNSSNHVFDCTRLNRQRGFALIETLIAALILSVGLVGYMQLLQADLKNTDSALYRNQAAVLIGDMFDRLRADSDDALDGDYNIAVAAAIASQPEVAQLTRWRGDITAALPLGSGGVACADATRVCTVTIQWDDSRGTGGSVAQTLAMSSLIQ